MDKPNSHQQPYSYIEPTSAQDHIYTTFLCIYL